MPRVWHLVGNGGGKEDKDDDDKAIAAGELSADGLVRCALS